MTDRPTVSVVLPCFNEAASVQQCVREALTTMADARISGEVVVVDNASTDGSGAIAEAAGARVITEGRPGYGSALRAGFAAAAGEMIVMADADLTYDLRKIPELVAPVARGDVDLTLGARLDAANRRTMPALHRFVGTPVLTFLVARACGRRVASDSQSGFRAFRADRIAALELQSTGMELASEMLIRAARGGFRVTEIQTGYRERVGESKLNTLSDGWRHLQLILLLAPDLLLIGPGLALALLGVALGLFGFVWPSGVSVGSLRWQPVFFSGIASVIGMQALLTGAVWANRSSLTSGETHRRFAFVGRPTFLRWCVTGGLISILIGLALDLVLFLGWLGGSPSAPERGLGVASVAQTLLILGSTLAFFGILSRPLLHRDAGP